MPQDTAGERDREGWRNDAFIRQMAAVNYVLSLNAAFRSSVRLHRLWLNRLIDVAMVRRFRHARLMNTESPFRERELATGVFCEKSHW